MIRYVVKPPFVDLIVTGDNPNADLRRVILQIADDARVPPDALLLIDGRKSTATPSLADTQERFGYFRVLTNRALPLCALIVSPARRLAVGSAYELEGAGKGGMRLKVFTSITDGRKWLRSEARKC
jgi:hypothetical protein